MFSINDDRVSLAVRCVFCMTLTVSILLSIFPNPTLGASPLAGSYPTSNLSSGRYERNCYQEQALSEALINVLTYELDGKDKARIDALAAESWTPKSAGRWESILKQGTDAVSHPSVLYVLYMLAYKSDVPHAFLGEMLWKVMRLQWDQDGVHTIGDVIRYLIHQEALNVLRQRPWDNALIESWDAVLGSFLTVHTSTLVDSLGVLAEKTAPEEFVSRHIKRIMDIVRRSEDGESSEKVTVALHALVQTFPEDSAVQAVWKEIAVSELRREQPGQEVRPGPYFIDYRESIKFRGLILQLVEKDKRFKKVFQDASSPKWPVAVELNQQRERIEVECWPNSWAITYYDHKDNPYMKIDWSYVRRSYTIRVKESALTPPVRWVVVPAPDGAIADLGLIENVFGLTLAASLTHRAWELLQQRLVDHPIILFGRSPKGALGFLVQVAKAG